MSVDCTRIQNHRRGLFGTTNEISFRKFNNTYDLNRDNSPARAISYSASVRVKILSYFFQIFISMNLAKHKKAVWSVQLLRI